jgi:hypothetical protein
MSSVYYLNLMYGGLRISDTLHKKPCLIGPGWAACSSTSQNADKAKFAEFTFQATR